MELWKYQLVHHLVEVPRRLDAMNHPIEWFLRLSYLDSYVDRKVARLNAFPIGNEGVPLDMNRTHFVPHLSTIWTMNSFKLCADESGSAPP
jgi:hypothetical protein